MLKSGAVLLADPVEDLLSGDVAVPLEASRVRNEGRVCPVDVDTERLCMLKSGPVLAAVAEEDAVLGPERTEPSCKLDGSRMSWDGDVLISIPLDNVGKLNADVVETRIRAIDPDDHADLTTEELGEEGSRVAGVPGVTDVVVDPDSPLESPA